MPYRRTRWPRSSKAAPCWSSAPAPPAPAWGNGKAAIVNVPSVAAIRYTYPYPSYQASKAGLNQLTVSTAMQ